MIAVAPHPRVARLRQAWKETDQDRALEQLASLAVELDRTHPGAAASLREGVEEHQRRGRRLATADSSWTVVIRAKRWDRAVRRTR
jgi:hypothetical protein